MLFKLFWYHSFLCNLLDPTHFHDGFRPKIVVYDNYRRRFLLKGSQVFRYKKKGNLYTLCVASYTESFLLGWVVPVATPEKNVLVFYTHLYILFTFKDIFDK